MKTKIILLLLFATTVFSGWAQSISVTSIPSSTQAGANLTVNYKYTSAVAGKVSIVVSKNGGVNEWDFISTVAFDQLDPAVAGTDVTGSFTLPIWDGTTPTAGLTGNENYRVTLELKDSSDNWLAGDYSNTNYNITAIPSVSVTAIPSSTQAGTNLVLNYKYTAASAGKVSIVVTKNGGVNPWDYISTVVYNELNPAVAGIDVTGTFTVAIPGGTSPSCCLAGNENYRVTLELKDAGNNWLAGDYSNTNYNITAVPAISVTAIPTSTLAGTNLTVNYKYTASSAGKVSVVVTKNGGVNPWDYISTVVFDQLDPAVAGVDVTGTFNVLIPGGTIPTLGLTGNENYRVTLELKDASNNWLAGDYSNINYNIKGPSITVTAIPASTLVGTNLTVNYKYTAAAAGKVSIVVSKNGGVNPWDYISTVVFDQLDPAAAGTDVTGSFTVPIWGGTTPTAALTGNENYRVTLELKDASNNWLAGDYSTTNYNLTGPFIGVTSIPTSTQAGRNLKVNFKYTAASAGKVSVVVTKNGGANPWDYIETVVYAEKVPAVAGTNVSGSFTVLIPAITIPTASLTGNENYRVTLELKDAGDNWLAGDYSKINYNITEAITELRPMQCGKTLTSLNPAIQASPLIGATAYTFEVTRTDNNVVDTVVSPNYFFFPATKITGGLVYGKSYSVRVKCEINGNYQSFGNACIITAPAEPLSGTLTKIRPMQCGKTMNFITDAIQASPVYLAVRYEFEVSNGVTTIVIPSNTSWFRLSQFPGGGVLNTAYTIRVRSSNGPAPAAFTAWGDPCVVTTPIARMSEASNNDVFEVKSFPNPFASHFNLDIDSSSDAQVEMKVYDMIGRQLEVRKASVSELSVLEVGRNYPAGVYNLVVSQGANVKSVRMVKR
ncbi:T9SS type A sorting domain-containing protein [Flavobacterium luteum]|uniref:T9SS type A sorting domain-containing protein n=1 Tax=Flavobacterium luteum TaxID=2026654 RepID=A0A7J5A805_9FLAO|nr:T9SS type A sorting domain-containing protein [Flavobacterium luteum]KAB1153701.1 T9SS type A sorting domain-containing protein [Flavobacterium luteum]